MENKRDIKDILVELIRVEKAIRMELWLLDLIGEADVNWLDNRLQKDTQ